MIFLNCVTKQKFNPKKSTIMSMPIPRTKEEWEAYERLRERAKKPFNEDGTPNRLYVTCYS